jgi:predicted transcriptional regulator
MKANYMDKTNRLLRGALESEEAFKESLLEVLDSLGMTIQELSRKAGVSSSTL